jgi:hypothetical protein
MDIQDGDDSEDGLGDIMEWICRSDCLIEE